MQKILHIGPVKNAQTARKIDPEFDLIPGLGVDGPSHSIMGLACGLSQIGVKVGLLSTKPFIAPKTEFTKNVTFLTPYTGKKYDPFINAKKWMRQIENEFGKPDLINFHDVYDLFSCALASRMRRHGWKYIVTPRGGLRVFAQKRDRWKKIIANPLFFKKYIRGAEFIQTLAENEAKELPLFESSLKTNIIPNGIDENYLTLASKLRCQQDSTSEITIGFLGQLYVHIKGIDILIRAIAKLQKNYPNNHVRFILGGPINREDDRKTIDSLLSLLPHPEKVKLAGAKFGKEKWHFLANIDVFVLPSRTEGMPVVGLEAMAAATPCLFSTGTNMSQIIIKANGGWDAGASEETLYEKLVEISAIPREKLRVLGENACQYIKDNYLWHKVAQQYLAALGF